MCGPFSLLRMATMYVLMVRNPSFFHFSCNQTDWLSCKFTEDASVDMKGHCWDFERYNIEIISQPTEVNDLEYNLQWSEVISEKLTTVSTTTLKNHRNTPSVLDYVFMEKKPISFSFTQSYGPKIGSTKLFAEIPEGTVFISDIPMKFGANKAFSISNSFILSNRRKNISYGGVGLDSRH